MNPWEKMSGESVLLVLITIPAVTVIRWNCSVRWLPSQISEASFLFQKLKTMRNAIVMKRKMNQCAFLACLGLQLPSFTGGKYSFLKSGPNAQVKKKKKKLCLQFQSCVKHNYKTQYTIPWEWQKRSGESILWVLTAIPVVILIRWNCSERSLASKKWLAACFIQKIPKLDQSCCFNEEKNETVFFSRRFEATITQIWHLENIAFNLKAQSKAFFFQKTKEIDQSCCNE